MTLTITPDESAIFTALRAFLLDLLPAEFDVIQAQDNRVPEPKAADFITMTPLRMPRLSTNVEAQASLGLQATFTQSEQAVIQLDIHGPASLNHATIISTMFRSGYAVDFFATRGTTIAPLFADDPKQLPFINAEQQYETRWVIEANLQVDQTITVTTQSATELAVGIVDVETPADSWPNAIVTAP